MKVPFSYKQHIFGSVLIASTMGHLAFFAAGGFITPSPQYAVEKAPSSMEVVILKEPEKKAPEIKTEKVMTVQEPRSIKVSQKKDEKPALKPPEKNVFIPPVKGAQAESKPAYLKNPAPVYPNRARERGWEGVVNLEVFVGSDGLVHHIRVGESSGYGILDDSALRTVRTWRFRPARVGNLSFSSWIRIPVRFLLVEDR